MGWALSTGLATKKHKEAQGEQKSKENLLCLLCFFVAKGLTAYHTNEIFR
jgi:hypothetical protein